MTLAFDLWHEDAFEFEDSPELFVLLDQTPLIWSVRGVRYLWPRLRHVGVDPRGLKDQAAFTAAYALWQEAEWKLLLSKLRASAEEQKPSVAHECLLAIALGRPDARQLLAKLDHQAPHLVP